MKQANVVRKYFNKMQRQAMAIGAHMSISSPRAVPENLKELTPGLSCATFGKCPARWAP